MADKVMTAEEIAEVVRQSPLGLSYDASSLFSDATWSQRLVSSTWAAHTHTYRTFGASPRLYYCADVPESGKTTHMDVTAAMSHKPLNVAYASQASFYSYLDQNPDSTCAFDEIDKKFGATGRNTSNNIFAAVVNAGYRRNGQTMVMRGGKSVIMKIYAPVAMAGIGTLPGDTLTRCIPIKLEKGYPAEEYDPAYHDPGLNGIGAQMEEWLQRGRSQDFLRSQPRTAPIKYGSARWRQITGPLFAIAALAGISDIFHLAVKEVFTGIQENPPTPLYMRFIRDLRDIWPEGEKILTSREVVAGLRTHPRQRWQTLDSGRLGELTVASYMRENGVETRVSQGKRGYMQKDVFSETIPLKYTIPDAEDEGD